METLGIWWLLLSVTDWFGWLLGISIKSSRESAPGRWCRERVKWTHETTQHLFPKFLELKDIPDLLWMIWMNRSSWLRTDRRFVLFCFVFNLKITLSDCKSVTAKAVASAKRKIGNLRITALGVFLSSFQQWCMIPMSSQKQAEEKYFLTYCTTFEQDVGVLDSRRRGEIVWKSSGFGTKRPNKILKKPKSKLFYSLF